MLETDGEIPRPSRSECFVKQIGRHIAHESHTGRIKRTANIFFICVEGIHVELNCEKCKYIQSRTSTIWPPRARCLNIPMWSKLYTLVSIRNLIDLYEAWGKPEKADE
ncbi:hypothetical protein ACFL3Q_15250 [Planctomycetota bacterium]